MSPAMRTWLVAAVALVGCGRVGITRDEDAAVSSDAHGDILDAVDVQAERDVNDVDDVNNVGDAARDADEDSTDAPAADGASSIGHNIVFVTSTRHVPRSLGGIANADAICRDRAAAAGLVGTFVAFLSDYRVDARDRLGSARGWVRPDGLPFADRIDDLARGELYYPPRLDETGYDVGPSYELVATGTWPDATATTNNCGGYMSPTEPSTNAGRLGTTTGIWLNAGTEDCTRSMRLYCFGTDRNVPLALMPATGSRAFLSSAPHYPGGGLAAADAICTSEASLAGLAGTFRALLSTSSTPAATRFDLSRPGWVRLDGIALGATRFAFLNGRADAPLTVTSLGAHRDTRVWTGGNPNMRSASHCDDWSAGVAASGFTGLSSYTGDALFSEAAWNCGVGLPVYCLEE